MFKNHLKFAIRNILKNKIYSFINIAGFAVGIGCALLILIWVQQELSYDKFHEKSKRIYRVIKPEAQQPSRTSFPLADILKMNIPEIQHVVRISNITGRIVDYNDEQFLEENFFFADPDFFKIFSFPLTRGDINTVLTEPYSVVLTQEMATKYFGEGDPIGKVILVDNRHEYKVTGIVQNIPKNSHFKFDFLATFVGSERIFWPGFFDWSSANVFTYLLFQENYSIQEIKSKLNTSMVNHSMQSELNKDDYQCDLQALTDIYLHSADFRGDIAQQGNIVAVYVFSLIAFFIILIACFNYMNMSTAQSTLRAVEVGIKKVIGCSRSQLIKQFFVESLVFSVTAFLIALILLGLFLPIYNSFTNNSVSLLNEFNFKIFLYFIIIILFTSVLSASYPAFLLSAFQPIDVLKGNLKIGLKSKTPRKILVTVQFVISIALIVGTIIISKQFNYLSTKKLGFDKDQVIVVDIPGRHDLVKNKLLRHSNIVNVSTAYYVPPERLGSWSHFKKVNSNSKIEMPYVYVDYDYFNTLGIKFRAGRTFSQSFSTDLEKSVILNESAAKALDISYPKDNIIDSPIRQSNLEIIGIVEDFHFEALYERIKPVIFLLRPNRHRLIIKIRPNEIQETIAFIKNEFRQHISDFPFLYHFVDDWFEKEYKKDLRMGAIFNYLTLFSIFIVCLGLFGLVSFTAEQRTKEIGIRKVLGASVSSILAMLSKDFIKWVLLASLIAWPIAYYAMNQWLQNFAYRIDISWWIFVLAGLLALVIALLTVSWQAIRVAVANPVESLRYE